MKDHPSAYIVDDDSDAIELFRLLKQIDGFETAVSMSLQEAFQTDGKTVDEVAKPCVDRIVSVNSPQCVIFLDLHLHLSEKIKPDVRTHLRTVLHLELVYAQDAPDYYQGLAVANRIIELLPKDFTKRILFMIQTRGDDVPVPRVDNPRILFDLVPTILVSFGKFAGDHIQLFSVLGSKGWEEIKNATTPRLLKSFSTVEGFFIGPNSAGERMGKWLLHDDSVIADLLNDYLDPVRGNDGQAWTHNWTARDKDLKAGRNVIGVIPDRESNRALFMRDSGQISFHPEVISRDLAPEILKKVLERLDIQAQMIGLKDHFKLPAMPGIAFLLALRVLLNELAAEAPAERVEFRLDGSSYGLRILLGNYSQKGDAINQRGHGCIRRFLEKMRSAGGGQAADGVAGAICDVAHCRLVGLRNPGGEDWVKMLSNGQPHWSAWPSFLENGIEFRW